MANNCQIGGHTIILNDTNIGLSVTIHQNTTIGAYCMIGMGSVIIRDIPPFLVVAGNPASMIGVNKKGLEFRGIDRSIIKDVEELYSKRPLKLESNNDFINEELRKFLIYSKRKIIDI
jgi:UDP-N-acetylglucosamine acyltransferase